MCQCLSYIAHPMEDLNSSYTDTISKSPVVEEHYVQEILIVYVRRKLIAIAARQVPAGTQLYMNQPSKGFFLVSSHNLWIGVECLASGLIMP